jgi:serine phosphatase RsbU (regulator of sigma subunit)
VAPDRSGYRARVAPHASDPAPSGDVGAGLVPVSVAERVFDSLLDAAHLAAPHELPGLVSEHAVRLGALDAVAYLIDMQQTVLIPFHGSATQTDHQHEALSVDASLAGRCFQTTEVVRQRLGHDAAGAMVWIPLVDGAERLGVLCVTVPDHPGIAAAYPLLELRLRRLAATVAELVVTKTLYGDTIVRTRRKVPMSLAAEIQWALLPPLTFAGSDVIIAGVLEPAYTVAGDSIDYAVDHGYARFAIVDGMGHGLESALLASLTVAAYRNSRRAGKPMVDTALDIDGAVHSMHHARAFATGLLAELDLASGLLRWLSAGHPQPLLLRHGAHARALHVEPSLPFGLEAALGAGRGFAVGTERLEPGDRVVFYSDGITEARAPDGSLFGVERLVNFLDRQSNDDVPPPEAVRRLVRGLMVHQQGHLSDDATVLMVEWRSGRQRALLPAPPPAGDVAGV